MDVSIVIPTWNGLSLLRETLPSVCEAAGFYRPREPLPDRDPGRG